MTRLAIAFIISVTGILTIIVIHMNSEYAFAALTDSTNPSGTGIYHSYTSIPESSTSLSTPPTAPTTISQDDIFTTQAALSLTRATQTSNIINSKAYYDISFRTSTAGTVKTLEFKFPPGTYVGTALLVEAVGIGPGKIAASGSTATGQTITYTVDSAVNIPVFTNIRIQLANINNPPTPSDSLTISITTKNSAGSIIDGPTNSMPYSMKQ
jgi:hypothetical protein